MNRSLNSSTLSGDNMPGVEAVVVRQLFWNRERQRHRVGGLAAQVVDGKAMETRGVGHRNFLAPNFTVIARSGATKQSTLALLLDGLLRFARNDDHGIV